MFRVIPLKAARKSILRLVNASNSKSLTANAHSATAPATAGAHHHVFDRASVYPRIGQREIVGYGRNGQANYFDAPDSPCPAVRFREDTPEIKKLREKAKGDWSNLTIEEKKALYRADFCATLVEIESLEDGQWKFSVGATLLAFSVSVWLYYLFSELIYNYPRLETSSNEHQYRLVERMIAEGQGKILGVSSQWDYEKGDWKSK